MTDILIIGGGAAGMMAAVAAKARDKNLSVVIAERQARLGRKLLATGNGRCNITNADCENPSRYNSPFAGRVIKRGGLYLILEQFKKMGLECVFDGEGRAYPESDMAASVVDALRFTIEEMGVEAVCGFEVKSLVKKGGAFYAVSVAGETVTAKRVIVACGGKAGAKLGGSDSGTRLLKSLGHAITPVYPSITQLKCDPAIVRSLKGLKRKCDIALEVDSMEVRRETGEVLFCDYGISGIAAMALSREAAVALDQKKKVYAVLTVSDKSRDYLLMRSQALSKRLLEDFLSGIMPKRLGLQMLKISGVEPLSRESGTLTPDEAGRLEKTLNGWRLPVVGVNGFDSAQVTAGGASTDEFDEATLESKLVSGLYAAGETLDVDGECGGFNLTWAWLSGMAAGRAAAASRAR